MRVRPLHRLLLLLLLTAVALPVIAQEKKPNKVELISAKSAQLLEIHGQPHRKVVGPAKFLHNDTYLLCDTALWNVNTGVIDATGHVRIIQNQTQLSSETLQYIVDQDLAKFRGGIVQLEDKEGSILRTRYLDYNTKDSVAVFQDGAAMKDKDGEVIESIFGTYDSKAHLFVFNDNVNMYMDTTFVKTSRLEYRSDLSTAWFGWGTNMWQDDKMLSANNGWYKKDEELFMFHEDVHVLTEKQESWSDSLYYWRALKNADMLGHVELMDTTQNFYALAGKFEYRDSLEQIRMTREPAVMSIEEKKEGQRDTVYVGADVLLFRNIKRCDIPEAVIKDSEKRLKDISGDPVMEYRKKAAEAAAKAAEEAAAQDPNRPPPVPQTKKGGKPGKDMPGKNARNKEAPDKEAPPAPPPVRDTLAVNDTIPPVRDTLQTAQDTLPAARDTLQTASDTIPAVRDSLQAAQDTLPAARDTLLAAKDTLPPPRDTTKVGFVWGSRRVRLFRNDIQMSSDSLAYTDLDSLVRLYRDPLVFNEGKRQYAADSIYMAIRDKRMQKAHLLSNAFITIQEDPVSYDQIRGTEMVAYFDSTSALTRFDALGGAASLFYLEENGVLATVNKVESKMIYATFADGDIERMYYYESPKNDGYPTVQLPQEDKKLKGFRWEPERRPSGPQDVTSLVPRRSERTAYLSRPHAEFKQTNLYFPGYINQVYRDIAVRDSLKVVHEREKAAADSLRKAALADSLAVLPDSLATPADSLLMADSLRTQLADSLSAGSPADSLAAQADSLATPPVIKELTPAEQKALEKARKKEEKERLKAEKQAAREARWAEQDRRDAERKAAREQRRLERERARKLRALRKLEKRAQRDRALFEKYLKRYKK
ncbi:MAG: hypothetical protein IK008_07355 [Bacteroidales bacterium]|nr:hypothetical protein [Bacteroidales bacterium]